LIQQVVGMLAAAQPAGAAVVALALFWSIVYVKPSMLPVPVAVMV
jgi:predicted amino acid dehydrogenase